MKIDFSNDFEILHMLPYPNQIYLDMTHRNKSFKGWRVNFEGNLEVRFKNKAGQIVSFKADKTWKKGCGITWMQNCFEQFFEFLRAGKVPKQEKVQKFTQRRLWNEKSN
jgi:hypothetical protein